MDNNNREFIRKQLMQNGIENVDDETLDKFVDYLKDTGDLVSVENPINNSIQGGSKQGLQQQRVSMQIANNQDEYEEDENDAEDDEEEEIEELPIKKSQVKPIRNSIGTQRKSSTKNNERYEEDEELNNWSKRLKSIQSKALNLDTQIAECRKAIVDDEIEEEKDIPLYYGTSERKLDPYPTVKKKMSGGFIRPPPVRSSRRNGPKGRKLLYEERNPDYVPPPERRRDGLRWQIRQKLIYSDPRYH